MLFQLVLKCLVIFAIPVSCLLFDFLLSSLFFFLFYIHFWIWSPRARDRIIATVSPYAVAVATPDPQPTVPIQGIEPASQHSQSSCVIEQAFFFFLKAAPVAYGSFWARGSNQSCSCQPTPVTVKAAMWHLSHICHLSRSLWQGRILNSVIEAR